MVENDDVDGYSCDDGGKWWLREMVTKSGGEKVCWLC